MMLKPLFMARLPVLDLPCGRLRMAEIRPDPAPTGSPPGPQHYNAKQIFSFPKYCGAIRAVSPSMAKGNDAIASRSLLDAPWISP